MQQWFKERTGWVSIIVLHMYTCMHTLTWYILESGTSGEAPVHKSWWHLHARLQATDKGIGSATSQYRHFSSSSITAIHKVREMGSQAGQLFWERWSNKRRGETSEAKGYSCTAQGVTNSCTSNNVIRSWGRFFFFVDNIFNHSFFLLTLLLSHFQAALLREVLLSALYKPK